MSKKMAVYRCKGCGVVVEAMNDHANDPQCCGTTMQQLKENTTDAAVEKHVPEVERVDGGIKVVVGSVAHPMADDHWIEWIEVIAGKSIYRRFLDPGEAPEAFFPLAGEENFVVRAYCNLHGLWKA